MARRRWWTGALGLALVAGAATVLLLLADVAPDDDVAPPPRASSAEERATRVPPGLAGLRVQPRPGDADAATPDQGPTAAEVPDPASDAWPALDVAVVDASGRAAHGALVYALPAGSPGADDTDAASTAATDESGRARLLVPRPGMYDVGALLPASDGAAPLVLDVPVPGTASIHLELPRCEPVEVIADPDVPLLPGILVDIRAADPSPRAALPGRGSRLSFHSLVQMNQGRSAWSLPLDRGEEYVALQGSNAALAVEPRRFRPPSRIRLRVAFPFPAVLRFDIRSEEPAPESLRYIRIRVDWSVAAKSPEALVFGWGPRAPLSDIAAGAYEVHLTEPRGTVHWSGPGVVAGSLDFEGLRLDAAVTLRLPVEVRAPSDETPSREVEEDAATERRLLVEVDPDVPTPEAVSLVPPGRRSAFAWNAAEGRGIATFPAEATWVLFHDEGMLVAGPHRLAPLGGGRVVLRRGGYLVAVGPPPVREGLGMPRIARADGALMRFGGPDEFDYGERALLQPGLLLGPLEPGLVSFRVFLGGVEVATPRAVVRAGEYTPLEIGSLAPR